MDVEELCERVMVEGIEHEIALEAANAVVTERRDRSANFRSTLRWSLFLSMVPISYAVISGEHSAFGLLALMLFVVLASFPWGWKLEPKISDS